VNRDRQLLDAISGPPAQCVPEVIDRMKAIDEMLPDGDGLASFNRMYLAVTESVWESCAGAVFRDVEFLETLDVAFANNYFGAVLATVNGDDNAPHCWKVLVRRRNSRHVVPLQFAVAGCNAHINYDLVLSVVEALELTGKHPDEGHSDFTLINSVLERLEGTIRRSFEGDLVRRVDKRVSRVLDEVGAWSMAAAREAAWLDAELLWSFRNHPHLLGGYRTALDATVGVVSQCLLAPAWFLRHAPLRHAHGFWDGQPGGPPRLTHSVQPDPAAVVVPEQRHTDAAPQAASDRGGQ
jgi:hypothetical protein